MECFPRAGACTDRQVLRNESKQDVRVTDPSFVNGVTQGEVRATVADCERWKRRGEQAEAIGGRRCTVRRGFN